MDEKIKEFMEFSRKFAPACAIYCCKYPGRCYFDLWVRFNDFERVYTIPEENLNKYPYSEIIGFVIKDFNVCYELWRKDL